MLRVSGQSLNSLCSGVCSAGIVELTEVSWFDKEITPFSIMNDNLNETGEKLSPRQGKVESRFAVFLVIGSKWKYDAAAWCSQHRNSCNKFANNRGDSQHIAFVQTQQKGACKVTLTCAAKYFSFSFGQTQALQRRKFSNNHALPPKKKRSHTGRISVTSKGYFEFLVGENVW